MSVRAAAGRLARRLLGDDARPVRKARFIVASLPRCGSTTVYRVLGSDPAIRIAYERPFFIPDLDPKKIERLALKHFKSLDGIKHVWDPNGWPFRNPAYTCSLDTLNASHELVLPNRTILECVDKVVFLRRTNIFARTISDFLGQQSDLWGPAPQKLHDVSEVERYRDALGRHVPTAIDAELFSWYMRHAQNWEGTIVAGFPPSKIRTVLYEDLFSTGTSQGRVPDVWQELAEWLGVKPDFGSREVRQMMAPTSKLNSGDMYERIPNYGELKARFGRKEDA